MLSRHDLRCSNIHRVEAGGAEPVDLHAWHMIAVIGGKRRRAGDVAARLANRIDAAKDNIVDELRVQAYAILDGTQHRRGKAKGRDLMQSAVRLAAAARRADSIINESVGQSILRSGSSARNDQNCSGSRAIMVAAPVVMRARRRRVSGIIRSMKNLALSNRPSIAAASPSAAALVAIAAFAICAHI